MNGHTSGVSVFGSDETNAGRRERRRRMRADRHTCANNWSSREWLNVRADGWSRDKSEHLLFSRTTLDERLRCRAPVFLRDSATGHVCATVAFASLMARRVRQDARSRREPQWRDSHRQRDYKQDRSCLAHRLMSSTKKAARRMNAGAGTQPRPAIECVAEINLVV